MSEERYKQEFPDYDGVLPKLDGWDDASWHNDTCPHLSHTVFDEFGVVNLDLFVDYRYVEQREDPTAHRFTFYAYPAEGGTEDGLVLKGETLEGLRREALDWFLGNVGDSILEEDLTTAQILEQVGTMWGFHNMKPKLDEGEQLRQRLAQFIVPTGGGCEAYSIPVGFCCVFITDAGGCGLPSPGGDIPMLVGLRNANGEEVAVIETDSTLADVVKFVEALGGRADA